MPSVTIFARGPHARPAGARQTAGEVDWRHHAACRDEDPELWFPVDEDGESESGRVQIAAAKAVCRRCPVRKECLADARNHSDYGIFSGLTRTERRELAAVTV